MSVHARLFRTLAAASTLALAAACGPDTSEPAGASSADDGVQVVATTSILGDVMSELVGDQGEVTTLMGSGVDPHAYAPSAQDAAIMREADLVVANGLGLEESLLDALEAAREEGVRVVELAPQLDPLAFDECAAEHAELVDEGQNVHANEGEDDHADEGEDAHVNPGNQDPHVWFDPLRMADGIELLVAELIEVAPSVEPPDWEARGAVYADELHAIDAELAAAFDAIPEDRRTIVTNHDSLGYLAARYDLEVVGTVTPGASTQAESVPRQFAELAETVEEAGITTIFAENTSSLRLAEQLASEVIGRSDLEVEIVQISTGAVGKPGTPAESYLGLLRETGMAIAEALADQ